MGRRPMTHDQRAKMRARILEAARERFLEEGLDGLSMRGIASKVGVSSMTLYLYYESRQDIIRHISVEAFKQLNVEIEKAAKSGKPGEKIRQVLDAYIKWALANHRFYGAMYNYVADDDADVPNDPLLNGIENRNGNADVNYTANTLKGAFTAAGHSAAAASRHSTFLWGALHGAVTLQNGGLHAPRGTSLDEMKDQWLALAEQYLANVEAEPKAAPAAKAAAKKR